MRIQLKICEEYSKKFRIVFNATKSACMVEGQKSTTLVWKQQVL